MAAIRPSMGANLLGGILFIGLLAACGSIAPESSSGGSPPACTDTDNRIKLSPAQITLAPGVTRAFSVVTTDSIITASSNGTKATWSVDGGDAFGTTQAGPATQVTYVAPATVPTPNKATIRARLTPPNDTICATATVTIQ